MIKDKKDQIAVTCLFLAVVNKFFVSWKIWAHGSGTFFRHTSMAKEFSCFLSYSEFKYNNEDKILIISEFNF